MLEVSRLVASYLLFCIAVTCLRDQNSCVDNQTAQLFEGVFESRKNVVEWPQIGAEVFGKVLGGEFLGWLGT